MIKITASDPRFKSRLRAGRVAAGYASAAQFAADIGMPTDKYISLEAGKGTLDMEHLLTISKITNKTVRWLTTGSNERLSDPI